jgi:hypothetical protein
MLTHFIGTLSPKKLVDLDRALLAALGVDVTRFAPGCD